MPAVLPVTIAKEETQVRLSSTKKQIYELTAIYENRAVVSTGGPALFDARNYAPNWLTPLPPSGTTFCTYYIYIFLHIPGTGYVFRFYYTGIYMCTNNIDDAIPLPGHNRYSSNNYQVFVCHTTLL